MRGSTRLNVSFAVPSFFLILLGFASPAQAQSPEPQAVVPLPVRMEIEGELLTVSGTPRSGPVPVVISLYNEKDGVEALWTEQQIVTVDESGRYTLSVGATTEGGIPTDLFKSGRARWIGITPQGDLESPRMMIVTVPYAAKAGDAETVAGQTVAELVRTKEFREAVRSLLVEGVDEPVRPRALVSERAPRSLPPLRPTTDADPGTPAGLFEHLGSGQTTGLLGRAYSASGTAGDDLTVGVSGVRGEVIPTAPGGYSAGVRGINYGTGRNGIGVVGYQAGDGWGVYGVTEDGVGVYGLTNATTGAIYGVRGDVSSPAGAGVRASYAGEGLGTALLLTNGALRTAGANRIAFPHTLTEGNAISSPITGIIGTIIDHPMCNGDPNALLFVTQRTTNVAHTSSIVVFYDSASARWGIVNLQGNMPLGAEFNVLVIKQGL